MMAAQIMNESGKSNAKLNSSSQANASMRELHLEVPQIERFNSRTHNKQMTSEQTYTTTQDKDLSDLAQGSLKARNKMADSGANYYGGANTSSYSKKISQSVNRRNYPGLQETLVGGKLEDTS